MTPLELYPDAAPVAHLHEFAGRVFLARHDTCKRRWYALPADGRGLLEGAEPADTCTTKALSFASRSSAKRFLRSEYGPDVGFIEHRPPQKKFE